MTTLSQTGEDVAPAGVGRLSFGKVKVRVVFLILIGALLSLAGAYRWFGVGPDYPRYIQVYTTLSYDSPLTGSRFEPGFLLVLWLFKFVLGTNFQIFLVVLIAFTLSLKFTLIWKLTHSPVMASIIYICLLYPLHEYTAVRAAIGLGFAYFAIYKSLQGKYLLAVALFGLGVLFHHSVLVLAAATFVFLVAWNNPKFAVICIVAAVIGFSALASGLVLYVLKLANPLAVGELFAITKDAPVRSFSTFPLLFYFCVLTCAFFLTPWREKTACLFFFLSVVGAALMIGLREVPIISARLMEVFEMSAVLLVFHVPLRNVRVIPAVVISIMAIGWCVTVFLGLKP